MFWGLFLFDKFVYDEKRKKKKNHLNLNQI